MSKRLHMSYRKVRKWDRLASTGERITEVGMVRDAVSGSWRICLTLDTGTTARRIENSPAALILIDRP